MTDAREPATTTKCECPLDAIKTRLLGPPPVAGAYHRIAVLEAETERVRAFLRNFHMADNRNAWQIARLQDEALSFLPEAQT